MRKKKSRFKKLFRKKSSDQLSKGGKKGPPSNGDDFNFLKFIQKDFLVLFGHPMKIIYENVNDDMSMKAVLKKALKRARYMDPYLFRLNLDYSKEIRAGSTYLAKVWDEVNKREIDPKDLEIFRNIEFFVEFLVKRGEIDLLRELNLEIKKQTHKSATEEEQEYEIVED